MNSAAHKQSTHVEIDRVRWAKIDSCCGQHEAAGNSVVSDQDEAMHRRLNERPEDVRINSMKKTLCLHFACTMANENYENWNVLHATEECLCERPSHDNDNGNDLCHILCPFKSFVIWLETKSIICFGLFYADRNWQMWIGCMPSSQSESNARVHTQTLTLERRVHAVERITTQITFELQEIAFAQCVNYIVVTRFSVVVLFYLLTWFWREYAFHLHGTVDAFATDIVNIVIFSSAF